MVAIDQRVVGSKGKYHRNNGKLKMASTEFEKVMYLIDKDFLEDIGLIKCLSVLYDVPNPFLWTPALDGFELPSKRTCDFDSGESGVVKCQGIDIRKVESRNLLMQVYPSAEITSKTIEGRLMEAEKLMEAIEEPDFLNTAKAKEKKKAKATEKFNSRNKTKNTDNSDVRLISKTAEVPDSRKKAKTNEVYDSRKRAKARGKFSAKRELKATKRDTSPGKELILDESEAGKETDNQEEEASNLPVSKSVRTCMNCGLQEPAPKVFKKCRRCKDEGYPDPPYYCGRDCQVFDWTARHRQEHEKNNAGDPAKS